MEILCLDIGMLESVDQVFLILIKKMKPENRSGGRGEVHFLRSCAFQSLPEIRHHRVGAGSNLLIPCLFHPWNSCAQQLQYVGIFRLIHYSGKRYFLLFLIF